MLQEIVNALPSFSKGEPSWEEAKTFGVGWLLTNINVLKRTVEKIAKAAFQKSKDPLDAAIFYLAMKKKMVLWGLFRSVSNPWDLSGYGLYICVIERFIM